jgi:hypothetical protein
MRATDLWKEFIVEVELPKFREHFPGMKIPMCGLCGNNGVVNTVGVALDPLGEVDCGIKAYCICPNGRQMKKMKISI